MEQTRQLQLTPHGLRKLKRECERLEKQLGDIMAQLRDSSLAREMEDLNFALVEQKIVQTRLQKLEQLLRQAKSIVTPASKKLVGLGNTVYLQPIGQSGRREEGQLQKATLVNSLETDPLMGYISIGSPLGKALLGRRANDIIETDTPLGRRKFTICKVE